MDHRPKNATATAAAGRVRGRTLRLGTKCQGNGISIAPKWFFQDVTNDKGNTVTLQRRNWQGPPCPGDQGQGHQQAPTRGHAEGRGVRAGPPPERGNTGKAQSRNLRSNWPAPLKASWRSQKTRED